MSTIYFGINTSIDGSLDHNGFSPQEEIHEFFTNQMKNVDLLVFGRKMYQLMFPYWSDVSKAQSGRTRYENEFADTITNIEKIVFSTTLEHAEHNTRILRGNLEAEIRKLKQEEGKKISIDGINLCAQLTKLGLIDEYYFVLHPVISGKGPRLMDGFDLPEKVNLRLVDSKVFSSGCLALHYVKA